MSLQRKYSKCQAKRLRTSRDRRIAVWIKWNGLDIVKERRKGQRVQKDGGDGETQEQKAMEELIEPFFLGGGGWRVMLASWGQVLLGKSYSWAHFA